jgi:hypothetical protein
VFLPGIFQQAQERKNVMGDKSPKAVSKKTSQKQIKATTAAKKKLLATAGKKK